MPRAFAPIWARDQHHAFSECLPGFHSQNPPRSSKVGSHSCKVSGVKCTSGHVLQIVHEVPSESSPSASEFSRSTTLCAYQDSSDFSPKLPVRILQGNSPGESK